MDKGEGDFQIMKQVMNMEWKALVHRTFSSNFSQIGPQMAEIWCFKVEAKMQAQSVWNYQGNFHFGESVMDNNKWSLGGQGPRFFSNSYNLAISGAILTKFKDDALYSYAFEKKCFLNLNNAF